MDKKDDKVIPTTTMPFGSLKNLVMKATIDKLPSLLKTMPNEFLDEQPNEVLKHFIKSKRLKNKVVIEAAALSTDYFYSIHKGKRKPSRLRTIQFCFGLKLSVDEANDFLKKMGHNELYLRSEEDFNISVALKEGRSIYETDELLIQLGYDPIVRD